MDPQDYLRYYAYLRQGRKEACDDYELHCNIIQGFGKNFKGKDNLKISGVWNLVHNGFTKGRSQPTNLIVFF